MALKLNRHDMQFILDQIKIAEAHAAGTPLDQLIAQPHLPYGLRTVDGSYNNLLEGREMWGASDQLMPRMLNPHYMNEGDENPVDINGPMAPGGEVDNTDYGVQGNPTNPVLPGSNGGHTGNVVDSDPRIITNLISDQTLNNPAAVIAALQHAEYDPADHGGASILDAAANIRALHLAYVDASANGGDGSVQLALRDTALEDHGIEMDGNSIKLPNVAPDEGLSAPFNGWMTFFGQFFDHGLDLIHKGDNGTIFVPLAADDPLRTHGPDGIAGSGDEVPPHLAFMAITRLKPEDGPGADGVMGTADDTTGESRNKTTPFVDQNQTYTSHASHQVFLREYKLDADGRPMATGHLLDGSLPGGTRGGLATWKDVKDQARDLLGIELDDRDVFGVPLLRTDPYGEFIRDENGFPQVVINIGPDLIPNTADDVTVSGTPSDPVVLRELNGGIGPVRTSHAFLDDIAHSAVPVLFEGDTGGPSILNPDPNTDTDPQGNPIEVDEQGNPFYDNELLDQHFITGDGRGNENIGLTTVHHVFHSEHNRQVDDVKKQILDMAQQGNAADLTFLNEWLHDAIPLGTNISALTVDDLNWDGERLFQTARFATEMQYQHLVFEEFGRKVQPNIDLFVFNTVTDVNPAIFAEFAHTVYRFGHSMLTDGMKLLPLDAAGNPVGADGNPIAVADWGVDVGLIEAFLNPMMYDHDGALTPEQAAGAIARGMTYLQGNEIDEFVVESLRNNLLGLPLDLAAINIARARDAGVPSLNEAREQLFAASNSTWLKPYESWADFGANLKTPASLINFIAAYGTHDTITDQVDNGAGGMRDKTMAEKRDAAMELLFGQDVDGDTSVPGDRLDFLHGTGAYADGKGGLNTVDLWIGGLAEKLMPFGGMLGSTFNAVFELQMENLQEGDRFYYLSRVQGLNLLNELENNALSKMIMANTDLAQPGADGILGTEDDVVTHHIGVDSFAKYDGVLEVDLSRQIEADAAGDDPFLNAIRAKVQRDDPGTTEVETNYLRFTGGEHMVMGGTADNDTIIGGDGDDGIWGGAGDDDIEGGHGVDLIIGGAGDDIITDSGDTGDFMKGEGGDDVMANSNGLDVMMGGDGKDVFFLGTDATEVFGGEGDDFMLGGLDHDFILGNEGDDWMEGGDGFDVLNGDNSELFFNSTILGHDVMFAGANENDFDAESGDDIMVQGESVMRNEGMFGFDWGIYKGSDVAADADMAIPFFTTVFDDILRDRFDQVEALSGWDLNDILRGDDRGQTEEIEVELRLNENHYLSQAGADRIDGLRDLLKLPDWAPEDPDDDGPLTADDVDAEKEIAWTAGNLLIGGDGSDLIEGRGGDDFIHGDAWLNVRIRIVGDGQENTAENQIATVDSLTHVFASTPDGTFPDEWAGRSLSDMLLDRTIKPNQMHIQREILYDTDTSNDTDTAVFSGNQSWYEITHLDDGGIRVARREMEEIDPQVSEGIDTLYGIERILFSDSIYTVRETGNADPTGRLVISGLPATEDGELTVSAGLIRDANNPDETVSEGSITFRWQVERNDGTGDYIDIPGVSGNSFTPDDDHVGLRIRVIGTYIDGGGVIEVVSSQPTDVVLNVNDAPTGEVLLSDMSPTEGQEVTATAAFDDADGITDAFEEFLLTYQWQHASDPSGPWSDVPLEAGGNDRTFTPGPELVGEYLRMHIVYEDDGGTVEEKTSAATQIVGNHIESNDAVINAGNGDAQGGTNAGADWVEGGASANTIDGGEGGDFIHAGGGNDTVNGGAGNDTLDGGAGVDVVNGGAGNDRVIHRVGEGAGTADGGAGNDAFRVEGTGGDDLVVVARTGGVITTVGGMAAQNFEAFEADAGGGIDTLIYSTTDNVSVNLLSGAATGMSFTRGFENVISGTGNDTLQGNSLDNRLSAGGGDDLVRGGFGDDVLGGDAGNDSLYGEQGDDLIYGGAGDDRIDGGTGNDTASFQFATGAVTVSIAGAESFEPQNTGEGTDRLISIENLTGSNHADSLTGDDGDNVLDGGQGADMLTGNGGDDTYVVDNVGDVVVEAANDGSDTVRSSLATYTLGANVENLTLEGTADIDGYGNNLDNRLIGNSGDNRLQGGGGGTDNDTVVLGGAITDHEFTLSGGHHVESVAGGRDRLVGVESAEIEGARYIFARGTNGVDAVNGTAGNDLVLGYNGDDLLEGLEGDDILVGGAGADTMIGHEGDDTFLVDNDGDRVEGGQGIDTILSTIAVSLHPGLGTDVTGPIQVTNLTVENLTLLGSADLTGRGNTLDNVLTGNVGANLLIGGAGEDILIGNGGDDVLRGGNDNDVLAGGDGNDDLIGGNGIDTAEFNGPAGNYTFGFNAGGALSTVTDIVGAGGTDTLSEIERIQFSDGEVLNIVSGVSDNTDPLDQPAQASILFGTDGDDEIIGSTAGDVIIGGGGDDVLSGYDIGTADDDLVPPHTDDDIFIWRAGASGFDDGQDFINGGGEGVKGDLFQVIGNSEAETYRIYTEVEAVARGFALAGEEPEIFVTRQVAGGEETVIAQLIEIEEIVINGNGVSGSGSLGGGDTVQMIGSFDVDTSLRPDTITILGSSGDDTADIRSLQSDHRIVFKGAGGNDTVLGALRPRDVIELMQGKTIEDYTAVNNPDGTTTISTEGHSITFLSPNGMPSFVAATHAPPSASAAPDGGTGGTTDPVEDQDVGGDVGSGETGGNAGAADAGTDGTDVLTGTDGDDTLVALAGNDAVLAGAGADTISGGSGRDFLSGEDGDDLILAGSGNDDVMGGAGADQLFGDEGDDRLFGGDGDDMLNGGAGRDVAFGGAGHDRFVAQADDGDDVYYGDDMAGGMGEDTLDMSAIMANVTANLGAGNRGEVTSAATGTDVLWGVENIVTGSGDDDITAGSGVNVIDGGSGDDVFRFLSADAADGDTILGFEPGDRIDLGGIDANIGLGGNQGFTLVSGGFTGAGQLMISEELRADGRYAVIEGNTSGDADAEFTLSIRTDREFTDGQLTL